MKKLLISAGILSLIIVLLLTALIALARTAKQSEIITGKEIFGGEFVVLIQCKFPFPFEIGLARNGAFRRNVFIGEILEDYGKHYRLIRIERFFYAENSKDACKAFFERED